MHFNNQENQNIIKEEPQQNKYYTDNEYALYLRGIIGEGNKLQNQINHHIQNGSEEWITLYKFIKIRAVAVAQRGEDAYLTIGELCIAVLVLQLIIAVQLVSGPSIYCLFYFRFILYCCGPLLYTPIMFWTLLNTQIENAQKPWAIVMRFFYVCCDLIILYVVFFRCPAFNSDLVSFFLYALYAATLVHIESFISEEHYRERRFIKSIFHASLLADFTSHLVCFFKLMKMEKNTTFYVFLVLLILMFWFVLLSVTAEHSFGKYKVQFLYVYVFFKVVNIIFLMSFINILIQSGKSTEGFGLISLFCSMVTTLLLVYATCQTSTDNLLNQINAVRDSSSFDE